MKRLFSLLLLTAMLLSLSGCGELLSVLPDGAKDYFSDLNLQFEQFGNSLPSVPTYEEDTNSYGYYYDQLGENSKAVYRAICKDSKNTEGIPIAFRQAPIFYADTAEECGKLVRDGISAVVQPALDALLYDHPEIFWLSIKSEGGSTFRIATSEAAQIDGRTRMEVKYLLFEPVYADGMTKETVAAEEEALYAAALQAGLSVEEGADRYTVLSALQEYLCKTVTYESEAERAHAATGALIDGRAVCDGYAKAFKILCDMYEIPCLFVAGTATQNGKTEPHAWNYVMMEDERWYAVDVTWNDSGESATDDYFLVGAGTVTSLSHGHFENSHRANGKFSAGDYLPFSFPELSFFRYQKPLFEGFT